MREGRASSRGTRRRCGRAVPSRRVIVPASSRAFLVAPHVPGVARGAGTPGAWPGVGPLPVAATRTPPRSPRRARPLIPPLGKGRTFENSPATPAPVDRRLLRCRPTRPSGSTRHRERPFILRLPCHHRLPGCRPTHRGSLTRLRRPAGGSRRGAHGGVLGGERRLAPRRRRAGRPLDQRLPRRHALRPGEVPDPRGERLRPSHPRPLGLPRDPDARLDE